MNNFNKIIKEKFDGKENLSRLSKELQINPKTLNSWLSGVNPKLTEANLRAFERIATYIGMDLSELLVGEKQSSHEVVSSLQFKDQGNTYFVKITKQKGE